MSLLELNRQKLKGKQESWYEGLVNEIRLFLFLNIFWFVYNLNMHCEVGSYLILSRLPFFLFPAMD